MQNWYVMYTKPNREPLVNRQLEDRGIPTYFPHLQVERGHGRGIRVEPFFPHYLFFQADLDSGEANGLQWLPGIRNIVAFNNRPAAIPESGIEVLRQHLKPFSGSVVRKKDLLFKPGQHVEITSGPFEGLEAIFQKGLSGQDRVQILLKMLHAWTRVEINVDQLKPVTQKYDQPNTFPHSA
jgi:transcriptional antiterminator RfaH